MEERIFFKAKANLFNFYPNIKAKSVENTPVMWERKIVGAIGKYDPETDEIYGWLDIHLTANLFIDGTISEFEIYPI